MRPGMVSTALPLLLSGCGGQLPRDSAPAPCTGLEVLVGEGEFAYAPRVEGDPVTLVHGPQGGWHVALAGEVHGSSGRVLAVGTVVEGTQQVMLAGGGQEAGETFDLAGYDPARCTGTFFDLRLFVDDVEPGFDYQRFICTLEDNPLEIAVELTDLGSGETARGELLARARLDPADRAYCAAF